MLLRESSGDGVTDNFTSKVVFNRAFICALECLQKTLSERVKDWLIGASNYEIIDVRTKYNPVAANDNSTHTLFETHAFAAFSFQKSADWSYATHGRLTACHKVALGDEKYIENPLHNLVERKCRHFHCDCPRVAIRLVQRPEKCQHDQ